ncbi:hypothetical protein [Tardiphaga sp.]|uniref:hypothetical protein n=1 Tax=Tardiphaga sp. TaxID=1926292 RepID=UPI00352B4E6B
MPYALFSNSIKVSKAFPNKSDVWQHAAESGLVMEVGLGEEDPPRRLLDMGYAIHACAADPIEKSDATGLRENDMCQMITACQLNQRSAAAAS